MTTGGYNPGDPPSDRVLRLLDYAFLQWNDQWFKRREFPKYPHLLGKDLTKKEGSCPRSFYHDPKRLGHQGTS